jgi:hypothetical protein
MSEKEELVSEMMTRIDVLANKLGVAAEHLWEVMIRQALITGFIEFITFILLTFGLAMFLKLLFKKRLYKHIEIEPTPAGIGVVTMIIVAVIIFIIVATLFCDLDNTITKIFNPEYWAYQSFLGNIK